MRAAEVVERRTAVAAPASAARVVGRGASAGGPLRVVIPIRLVSPNRLMAEHYASRSRRRQRERAATGKELEGCVFPGGPWLVTITRVGSRKLDGDSLQFSGKSVRDAIAAVLGCDDGDENAVTWAYEQRIERRKERVPGKLAFRFCVWCEVAIETRGPA
jgi:hypothetical protein